MDNSLFAYERPIMAAMPNDTSDSKYSTNTGKTALALGMARVSSPAIPSAQRISDGMPAQRSAMADMNYHGTMALDEFRWATNESSLFSEPNLLSMCTGNSPNIGNVLSNETVVARLAAPLCMSVKVLEGKDDTFTRTIPLPLGQLTNRMRARPIYNDIIRGTWSISLRMSCLHMIDQFDLNRVMHKANPAGGAFRFNHLRFLASLLYHARTNAPLADAMVQIDACATACVQLMQDLYRTSVVHGTNQEAKGTGQAMFSMNAMVNDMNTRHMEDFITTIGNETFNARDMFYAYKEAKGQGKRPDESVFEDLTGCEHVKGQRLSRAINKELIALVPAIGDVYPLVGAIGVIHGWHIVRAADRARQHQYKLEQIKQTNTQPTQSGVPHVLTPVASPNPFNTRL
ncbi:MAG: hypothetical protein V3R81_04365 [Gammaproteobacteria bacterium]